ncbi:MAG: hypothetical protein ABSC41_19765 [Acidimicrobiales bacterium]
MTARIRTTTPAMMIGSAFRFALGVRRSATEPGSPSVPGSGSLSIPVSGMEAPRSSGGDDQQHRAGTGPAVVPFHIRHST